jgi:serine/threonine protein kinase
MQVTGDPDAGLVYKQADTTQERRRLQREAAILQAIPHPGVVQLVKAEGPDPPNRLVLRRLAGGDLTGLRTQPAEVIAGLGAALATTLADLHDLGVSHGAIEAAHVLLDEQGRPVLCSFGRAQRDTTATGVDARRRHDVQALAGLLLTHLAEGSQTGVGRTLRLVASPGRPRRRRNARWLARELAFGIPDARLPDPAPDAGQRQPAATQPRPPPTLTSPGRLRPLPPASRPWGPPARAGLIAAGLGLVVAGGTIGMSWWWPSPAPSHPSLPCPPVDDGCGPVPNPGGLLTTTGQYVVGEPGDVVVLGRWLCGPTALPAVLRPATGQLWTFAHRPATGQTIAARLLTGGLHGARSLRVRPQRSGCDEIEVDRGSRPPVAIRVQLP